MKKQIVLGWIAIIIIAGITIYSLWKRNEPIEPTPYPSEEWPSTESILSALNETKPSEETVPEVGINTNSADNYEWGGEYAPYSAQLANENLKNNKQVILFFHASRDPSDNALDKELQKLEARIPKNTIILKVDYDSNPNLKKTYSVTQQNTLIWLDNSWSEKTRRAMWVTSLAQILRVK